MRDSNPRSWDQNPVPYHLANPQHFVMRQTLRLFSPKPGGGMNPAARAALFPRATRGDYTEIRYFRPALQNSKHNRYNRNYMPHRFLSVPWLGVTLLCIVAGIVYSSWPLAYWLNPVVNHGLASDLEAAGQPYNWVFIGLDILSGLLVCIAAVWLLRAIRGHRFLLLKSAIMGFGLFGLLTAVDAILPLDCVPVVQRCGSVFDDPTFIVHGIASIGSVAGLTLSIIIVWWLLARDSRVGRILRHTLHSTVLTWFCFGVGTLVLILLNESSATAQHVFITLCSIWTALVPYFVWRVLTLHRPAALGKQVKSR
jgi:hypothetical protein